MMRSTTTSLKNSMSMGITLVLLLGSFLLALYNIEAVLNIVFWVMAALNSTPKDASAITSGLVFFLAIAVLAYTVAAMEYHLRHVGQSGSYKWFKIAYAVQGSLAVLGILAWLAA